MRDVQAGGRYVLYAVLFALAFGGAHDEPVAQWIMLVSLIVGVPGYWFWARSVHNREHDAQPSPTCAHCRGRLAHQRKLLEQEQMAQLNRKYRERA